MKLTVFSSDGTTSRDFTFIANVVQANLLAATTPIPTASSDVFNIAYGESTTWNQLFTLIRDVLCTYGLCAGDRQAVYEDFRPGDVRHSHASINKARSLLGYDPTHSLQQGLELSMDWYKQRFRPAKAPREELAGELTSPEPARA